MSQKDHELARLQREHGTASWSVFAHLALSGRKNEARALLPKMSAADRAAGKRWLDGPTADQRRESARTMAAALRDGERLAKSGLHCQFDGLPFMGRQRTR